MTEQLSLLTHASTNAAIRFVIFVSYGNDSIALLQWAKEQELEGVAVVFTDTGWAADGWMERVDLAEEWVRRNGFTPYRTSSIGFRQLARDKKGIPTQQFQWCSFILKIEPGRRWLEENDPDCRAVCLIGVRREESPDRADFPEWLIKSANHGGRMMVAPFATFTADQRDALILRAGFEILPHRSRECRCINSNHRDMQRFTDADWRAIAEVENEVGKTFFRPRRHMGAKGADQVREWANSPRGKYRPPEAMPDAVEPEDAPPEEDFLGVRAGKCDTFGGCGS